LKNHKFITEVLVLSDNSGFEITVYYIMKAVPVVFINLIQNNSIGDLHIFFFMFESILSVFQLELTLTRSICVITEP